MTTTQQTIALALILALATGFVMVAEYLDNDIEGVE